MFCRRDPLRRRDSLSGQSIVQTGLFRLSHLRPKTRRRRETQRRSHLPRTPPQRHSITRVIELDLAQFATAVRAHALRWEHAGIRWQLTFGPERAKSAAQVACGYPAQRAVMAVVGNSSRLIRHHSTDTAGGETDGHKAPPSLTLPLAAAKVDHAGEEA